MKPFRIDSARTLASARRALLDAPDGSATVIAGGADLLGEMKEGIIAPAILVDIGKLGMDAMDFGADGATAVGSMVTLARIAASGEIARRHPALSQAAASVATPQIRNAGTLGGNLCQRPRCWYYRNPLFDCLKKGGGACFAVAGNNKYHAILGADACHIVHPSDPATALAALGATARIYGADGVRSLPIEDFFVSPAQNMLSETALEDGEILIGVDLPPSSERVRSVFLKAKERRAYDFALASAAARVELDADSDIVARARVVLGGVAPVPYIARAASDALIGARMDDINPAEIGRLAVQDAKPMSGNGYKVRLATNLTARALANLAADFAAR